MRKFLKFVLVFGVICVVAGGVILALAIKGHAFDKEALVSSTVNIEGSFDKMNISLDTSDLEFKVATDGVNKIEYIDRPKVSHETKVSDGTLVVTTKDERKWYEKWFSFDFDFRNATAIIYLNETEYKSLTVLDHTGDVKVSDVFSFDTLSIEANTGSIEVEALVNSSINLKASTGSVALKKQNVSGDVKVESQTGSVRIETLRCNNLTATVSTGDIKLIDVVTVAKINAKTSTGDIKLENVDAESLTLKASTGSIRGNILTGKTFNAHSSTGHVSVPSTTGGACEANTSTGSIYLTVGK